MTNRSLLTIKVAITTSHKFPVTDTATTVLCNFNHFSWATQFFHSHYCYAFIKLVQ